MRRPQPTAESKARAERIARSLAGLLDDVPVPRSPPGSPGIREEDALAAEPPRATRTAEHSGTLTCPRCAGPMDTVAAAHGVEIDQCTECSAIWLDAGELEALTADQAPGVPDPPTMGALRARMREVLPSEGTVKYKDCPRCQQVMRRTNFGTISGVVVDECVQHGVLLDPGELQAIETFIRMGGQTLGAGFRVAQGQRQLAPPPPMPADESFETRRRRAQAASSTLWDVLFRW